MPAMPTVSRTRIGRGITAPALARRHVEDALGDSLPPSCLQEITLLTSELATNVVEYSRGGPVEVAVIAATECTRVEVTGPRRVGGSGPTMRTVGLDAVGGRGLFLVDSLSDRWGIDDDGSTVWFEFDLYEDRVTTPRRFAPGPE
jgi:anti-sigma regulatory factor (Ser/Thr protein kinase)